MAKVDPKTEELLRSLGAHPLYNPDTGLCKDGDEWCMEDVLRALSPAGGWAFLLWPAYLGARLWIALWIAIPWLFGFRFRVTVVGGVAHGRMVRNTPHEMPAAKAGKAGRAH